jgi:hypothetical protein
LQAKQLPDQAMGPSGPLPGRTAPVPLPHGFKGPGGDESKYRERVRCDPLPPFPVGPGTEGERQLRAFANGLANGSNDSKRPSVFMPK